MKRLAWALLAICPALSAQTNTGTVTGTVIDASKAAVTAVKVTATNLATNVTQTATTNSDGVYSLPALEPGTYRLTLQNEGFKKDSREPIRMASASTAALHLRRRVCSTSTSVRGTAIA